MGHPLIGTLLLVLATSTGYSQDTPIPFRLTNPLPQPRVDEVVTITRKQYLDRTGYLPGWLLPQAYDSAGTPIPTQADDLTGDGLWDEIAILVSLGPGHTARYTLGLLSPDRMPSFPHRTRAWLAPYARTSDTTGEYREVAWARINIDTTKSIYAQYQMGGIVYENQTKAYRNGILDYMDEVYEATQSNYKGLGPPHLYRKIDLSEYRPLPNPPQVLAKYWLVSNGPVRSLAYIYPLNFIRWVLSEVHPHVRYYRSPGRLQHWKETETTIRITGF